MGCYPSVLLQQDTGLCGVFGVCVHGNLASHQGTASQAFPFCLLQTSVAYMSEAVKCGYWGRSTGVGTGPC